MPLVIVVVYGFLGLGGQRCCLLQDYAIEVLDTVARQDIDVARVMRTHDCIQIRAAFELNRREATRRSVPRLNAFIERKMLGGGTPPPLAFS